MSLMQGVFGVAGSGMADNGETMDMMLQPLLPWWRQLPRDGRLPMWRGELVHDLRPWLGYLLMARFPREGEARYTLYGSELVEFAGRDLTGMPLSEALNSPNMAKTAGAYGLSMETGRPHWSRVRVDMPMGAKVRYDRLLLPFGCADGDTRVLGAIKFDLRLPRDWTSDQLFLTVEQEALLV